MTNKQSETLSQIKSRWETKKRGTYIDRHNSKPIYALYDLGLVKIFPYCVEFGYEAFPLEAK